MFACCQNLSGAVLTLTAMHPDGQHPTPSRHLPLNRPHLIADALKQLNIANQQGWGAYFAVGLRRAGLSRWQRGGLADVVALPALFVDVDDPTAATLERLRNFTPQPSCVVASGHGYHAYWWLYEPLQDMERGRRLLRALALPFNGDRMTPAQSMRLPGTWNTKQTGSWLRSQILDQTHQRHAITAFDFLLPSHSANERAVQRNTAASQLALTEQVVAILQSRGGRWRGDWINAPCPFPEQHKHGDRHPSFGFNNATGYGFCHVCGTLLLRDLVPALYLSLA